MDARAQSTGGRLAPSDLVRGVAGRGGRGDAHGGCAHSQPAQEDRQGPHPDRHRVRLPLRRSVSSVRVHPLRLLLYASVVVAAAVGWALGAALLKGGMPPSGALALGILALVAFLLPWLGVYLWAFRRAADLEELTDRTRRLVEGTIERPIADRTFHGELDDLGRAIEEMRMSLVRQRSAFETHRSAMDQIVSALGGGLIAVSLEGRVAFANPRVAEMFGGVGSEL